MLPSLTTTLAVLGLIDMTPERGPGLEISHLPKDPVTPRIYLDRLTLLLRHPDQYLQQTFKWGDADFDGSALLRKLQALIEGFGIPAAIYPTTSGLPVLEAFAFSAQADTTGTPRGLKIELSLPGNTTFQRSIDFSPLWKGSVKTTAAFDAGLGVSLRPPFTLDALPATGSVALNLGLGLEAQKTIEDPIVLLGVTGGTRLSARRISGSIGVDAQLGTGGGTVVPTLQLRIDDGRLSIDFSEADGFLKTLLSNLKLDANFGVVADWNPRDGLRFQGQGGIEILIPMHQALGPISISGLTLAIGIGAPAPLSIVMTTQLTAALGPLVAVVDHIGLRTSISFPSSGGNLGIADIGFAFEPPNALGLSIDTGAIKGGGFLKLDVPKGEYFGALEFSFQNVITLKALGIINTKMPDGSRGFALLILITAEFVPIQLGFGFTLIGVGGLLALNRTLDTDALRTGVRTGAVNSILFPQDIVANIGRIISDLKTIFPIAEGHFIIGPMGKLGWGTPTLISLEIGVILDLPRPMFVLVGVLRCILPAEDAPILRLQVNFAGGIDFAAGLIWFDASLFDSRLLQFTLTGDMALRIGWGDRKIFVLSVGGFHPAFREVPEDLRGMRRLTISLLSGENPRLTVQTYFAVTSNTVQSGSKAELYAEACGFNIYGFLGYDLLVQFNPFRFVARDQGRSRAADRAPMSSPASARRLNCQDRRRGGHAARPASSCSSSRSRSTSTSPGERSAGQIEQTEDVYPLLRAAVVDDRNWTADLPATTHHAVTLRTPTLPPARVLLHPFGLLAVSQKVVPLGLEINKFGNKRPIGATRFDLTFAGGEEVREEFAIANFTTMSDSDKLSRKSFEQIRSGIRFTPGTGTETGASVAKEVNYELSYVHRTRGVTAKGGLYRLASSVFTTLANGSAVTKNLHAVAARAAGTPPATITVRDSRVPRRQRQRSGAPRAEPGGRFRSGSLHAAGAGDRAQSGAGRHDPGDVQRRAGVIGHMSITVARYTFNSWLRRGIGTRIAEVDHLGGGTSAVLERATVPIDVVLNTEPLHKDFSLIGPGDIIGLLPSMVVRTEPLNRITNFEPNYLAFIEFYDEDFIWRYTPARANGLRLRPWLALLVAEEKPDPAQSEFEKSDRRVPLPSVTIRPAAALPPPDQAWAWGHVHINEGYDTPSQFEQFLLSLHNLNSPNADKIICRLMSPRKLRPNRAYRAFVVPAFETGRLAGLGRDPSAVDAQRPAWTAGASNVEFPIYYEWSFQHRGKRRTSNRWSICCSRAR